ncbi:MAG: Shedu immune nuclease family protein [Brumimicrobium sp.]
MVLRKGEQLEKKLSTKEVYFYYDDEKGIAQVSKDVFLNKDEFVHYPRGFDGGHKYKSIKKIRFIGFKKKVPVGLYSSVNYGYGFTKTLGPFNYFINENYKFNEVVIEKDGKTLFDTKNNILYLNQNDLQLLKDTFSSAFKRNKASIEETLQVLLFKLFPKSFSKPKKNYTPSALSSALSSWGNSIDEFSDDDKKSIQDLYDKLSLGTNFLSTDSLKKTKEIIDNKYIKATIKEFSRLLAAKSDTPTLEKKWQTFLKTNSWIFSSIFAQPVILYGDEAYVGGKTVDNKNGKFNDFLIQNKLSNNVSFLEIKTHLTKTLENSAYRGNDVFSVTKELSGSIGQVLNQRDNFQKEFDSLKRKSDKDFESFNSKCVVLIGTIDSLTDKQKYSFELVRSNSRDVEIITFDELLLKIESLQEVMSGKKKSTKAKTRKARVKKK